MGILKDLNIVKGNNTVAGDIFESLFLDFHDLSYKTPKDYIAKYWNKYVEYRNNSELNDQQQRGVNGKMFEYIIATLLIREDIFPFFLSAKVAFVPNINYDIMLYSKEFGPICLSAKTSFRERYKQADLEAIALKYVHRRSKSYLVTLLEKDADDVNKKQKTGDVIGLDKAVFALGSDFNNLIEDLKTKDLINSPKLDVVVSNQIVTRELANEVKNNR